MNPITLSRGGWIAVFIGTIALYIALCWTMISISPWWVADNGNSGLALVLGLLFLGVADLKLMEYALSHFKSMKKAT